MVRVLTREVGELLEDPLDNVVTRQAQNVTLRHTEDIVVVRASEGHAETVRPIMSAERAEQRLEVLRGPLTRSGVTVRRCSQRSLFRSHTDAFARPNSAAMRCHDMPEARPA